MSYFAVALSQRRRGEWERVLGTARLPVLDRRPRWAEFRHGSVLVYDVAVGKLHPAQFDRLAAYLARRNRVSYEEARSLVRRYGLTIRAEGVEVETADVWKGVGRFAFLHGVFRDATTSASGVCGSGM